MDRFVRTQNVERYCRLLDRVTEESERWQIIKLLTEERQKQKEAGDFAQLLAVSEAGTGRFADSGDGGQAFHLKADSESGRLRTAFR